MKKEDLIELGIDDEVAKQVMAIHGKTVTTLNSQVSTLEAERDGLQEQVTTNQSELNALKESAKGNEELTQRLAELQTAYDQSEAKLAEQQKTYLIESALKGAGATDVEYLAYKLGDVDLDKDGQVKDLDNKIKDLQANNPTFFESKPGDAEGETPEGFKTLEHKLDDGTISEKDATEQFINAFTSDITSQPVN